MRDMNLTYAVFKEQYEKQSERKFSNFCTENSNILRSTVVASPTLPGDLKLEFPSKFKVVRGLCLFWEKTPESIRYEIYFLLLEKIKKFDFKKQLELILLIDLETRLPFLYKTKRFSSHEIFGNLIQEGIRALHTLKTKKRNLKVKKPQRRRGYNDKGTLRCFAIWNERWKPSFDWTLTELQNRQERIINRQNKFTLSIKKFLRELT